MKKITIELSESSCKNAINELKQYQNQIKPRLDEVCKRLAEIGAEEARSRVRGNHGNTDITITVERIDNGYKIVASGTDVYFIEFGTGDQVSAHYDTSVPVGWGTWSAEHSQQLWKHGFWTYKGEKLTGTEAEKPMFYAEQKIRQETKRVTEEVFGAI